MGGSEANAHSQGLGDGQVDAAEHVQGAEDVAPGSGPATVEGTESEAAVRMLALRMPRAGEAEAPVGCSLRLYEPSGATAFWQAALPQGVTWEGQGKMRRSFRPGLRSSEQALQTCLQWLRRAEAGGVMP